MAVLMAGGDKATELFYVYPQAAVALETHLVSRGHDEILAQRLADGIEHSAQIGAALRFARLPARTRRSAHRGYATDQ